MRILNMKMEDYYAGSLTQSSLSLFVVGDAHEINQLMKRISNVISTDNDGMIQVPNKDIQPPKYDEVTEGYKPK